MHAAVIRVELKIPGVRSLKEKRRIVKSLIANLTNTHPLSVAEVDHQDLWQRSTIGIAVVLQTLWSLRVFELIFVLTKGAPADGTVLLNYFAYRTTFDFLDLGYGAAVANVIFALSFLLAATYVWLLRPSRRQRGA